MKNYYDRFLKSSRDHPLLEPPHILRLSKDTVNFLLGVSGFVDLNQQHLKMAFSNVFASELIL